MTFGFAYGYYLAGLALIQALNEVDGDLSDNHKALNEALSNMTLEGPFGTVTLDENRQAIIDTTVQQLVLEGDEVVSKTVATHQGCRSDIRWHVQHQHATPWARRPGL